MRRAGFASAGKWNLNILCYIVNIQHILTLKFVYVSGKYSFRKYLKFLLIFYEF